MKVEFNFDELSYGREVESTYSIERTILFSGDKIGVLAEATNKIRNSFAVKFEGSLGDTAPHKLYFDTEEEAFAHIRSVAYGFFYHRKYHEALDNESRIRTY